jgi:RNA polymerase sigma-70 factor, ECF subfamily
MRVAGSPTSAPVDERHLVERVRGGDRSAFRQVVESHRGRVYRIALALTRDHHDAEDLVQEESIRAYRSIGSFRGEAGSETAVAAIRRVIDRDASTDVRESAVEALAGLPGGEGLPMVIKVARTDPDHDIREAALDALAESDDPRAQAALREMGRPR